MSTSDEADGGSGNRVAGDDAQYEFKDVRAIRGTEARTIAKWRKDGWELVTQSQGTLRTEMTLRRVKPKTIGTQFRKFASQNYAAFRRLEPKTQRRLMVASGGLVLLFVIVGVVVGFQGGGGDSESTTSATRATTSPREQPSEQPSQTEPEAETFTYQGPQYEIVTVDTNVSNARLNQYWVYTNKFNYSTDEYRDQIKMIIEDIARKEKTAKVLVEVVTDREVAEAEAVSTYESFVEEHGMDYAINTIPMKEKSAYIASYTGGFDTDAGQPSESDAAFEVVWMPAATAEFEKWEPRIGG